MEPNNRGSGSSPFLPPSVQPFMSGHFSLNFGSPPVFPSQQNNNPNPQGAYEKVKKE